jgi:hypothetical protein
MTLKQHHQQAVSSLAGSFKKYKYVTPALMLLVGFILGASFIKATSKTPGANQQVPKTISFLMYDGASTRTWNGVSIFEGESVATVVDRIARAENIGIIWSGNGRDQQLVSFAEKAVSDYTWKAYINNASLPTALGRFYPRPGDTITLIYSLK